jgi:glycosyltransferase involved in cell wall biosynthesis
MIKILFFIDSFLPGYKGGGPVTSISNLATLLKKSADILICTKNHDFKSSDIYSKIVSNKITKFKDKNVIYLSKMNTSSIVKTIDNFNPDVIYLNSFFSKSTQLILFLNYIKFKKKIIVAPRGQLQDNALKIKYIKKLVYLFFYKLLKIQKNLYFHSTDINESNSIKKLLSINNITEIKNIVKIYKLEPLVRNTNLLKIIFVSRIVEKKNLLFSLQLLKSITRKVIFDIYGPIEDVNYWDKCKNAIDKLPPYIKVSYKGELPPQKVIIIMRKYHAFLLPTFSENFGHVIVEAMQAGLIPIISDQTPWIGLEKLTIGWSIPLNRELDYINAINSLLEINNKDYTDKSSRVIRYIHAKINNKLAAEKYFNFFNNINTQGNYV